MKPKWPPCISFRWWRTAQSSFENMGSRGELDKSPFPRMPLEMMVLISNAGWLLIPGDLQQTLRFIGILLLFTIVEVHFEPQALLKEYLSYAKKVQFNLETTKIYEKLWEFGRLAVACCVQIFFTKIREENGACTLEHFRETEARGWPENLLYSPIFWVQMLFYLQKISQCSECMD